MTQNSEISQGLSNLAIGLLGTTVALTVGLPQQAQAATLGVYAYAYQQITNLRISGITAVNVQSNTSSGSSLLTFNPTPPGQISSQFDVNESFVSSSQPSGANLGIGNNTGFFSGSPIPNSAKGQVNGDYSRGDAVVSSSNTTPTAITSATQLRDLLFGTAGVNGAGVAESYLSQPATTLFQTSPTNYYKDQGNGNGEWVINSNRFSVASDSTLQFNYNYLNKLLVQVDLTTPANALESNFARAEVGFTIQVNYRRSSDGSDDVLSIYQPTDTNQQISRLTIPGLSQTPLATGSQATSVNLPFDIDGDGAADQYSIVIRGRNLASTRLVEVPEPLTIFGTATAAGFGAFFKLTLNRKRKQDRDEG